MKQTHNWKIRVGAFCLTALCLGTGVALAAGAAAPKALAGQPELLPEE